MFMFPGGLGRANEFSDRPGRVTTLRTAGTETAMLPARAVVVFAIFASCWQLVRLPPLLDVDLAGFVLIAASMSKCPAVWEAGL
jgi:hypothetical protein